MDDESELQLMEFFSWEEFSTFFDDWCEKRKTLFFLRNYIALNKCKWAIETLQWEVVDALKYSSARLACKNINVSNKKEFVAPKERKEECASDEEDSKDQQGCGAYIFLKLSERKNSLVITKCQLQHNHPLCPIEFNYCFKKGNLLANCCLPIRLTNTISKQFVGSLDIKRLLSCCKTKDHGVMDILNSLDSLFSIDPCAKVKLVFFQDQVLVKTIFLVTTVMVSTCQHYPTVLFFNKVLSFNEDFDLFSFLCADENTQGKDCAYVLVRKGTANILRFASASLVQSIPDIKFKVRCVAVGVDIAEKEVVKEIFPHATVHILHSHVLHTLHSKALEMGVTDDTKLLSFFFLIAASKTPEDYNQAVKNLGLYCTDSFVKYFMDHWHTCREMWVDIWGFKFAHKDASEIVFQHKQKMADLLGSNATVAECILHLLAANSINSEQLKVEEVALHYKSVCTPDAANMIEEELSFLKNSSYNIKQTSRGFSLNDGVSEFIMDQDLVTCSCTIHTSSLLPCRHIFATRLQNGGELFDVKLLSKSHS
ncbi:uncharacterized protein ZSWIM9-like [Pyxicephalus adspersus]|uniref:SWIM-type domain-containing protein n=1 Tax=Pyxicephalus adspersus TaxID=30357 RepID=A0AAV2ZGP0_PYXAD|nr:TPA: hypothetical protein GDO54_003547 [Pyxicephalus adspersus]